MNDFSRKADDLLERFMLIPNTVGNMDKKYENRSEDNKQEHVNANQGETVITDLHSETTESEVINLLKEMMNEIGMDFGSARLVCPAKPITHAFIYFANDDERNKFIRSANMLKKELRGRKIRITRSMGAEERFYNKRMGYVKCSIHKRHDVLLYLISLNWIAKHVTVKGQIVVKTSANWIAKHVTVKGQIVVKTCQSGSLKFSKYQDVEDEVEELMQKWQTTNRSQRL